MTLFYVIITKQKLLQIIDNKIIKLSKCYVQLRYMGKFTELLTFDISIIKKKSRSTVI